MPWILIFGLGAYLLWKEREKLKTAPASAPVTVTAPIADAATAPPTDAPQDGGAPAPQDGGSGGGGYADPGPPVDPGPLGTRGVRLPHEAAIYVAPSPKNVDPGLHAQGIKVSSVMPDLAPRPTAPAPAPAPTAPTLTGSAIIAPPTLFTAPTGRTTGGKSL